MARYLQIQPLQKVEDLCMHYTIGDLECCGKQIHGLVIFLLPQVDCYKEQYHIIQAGQVDWKSDKVKYEKCTLIIHCLAWWVWNLTMKHEIAIRLISFVLIFIMVALWEIRAPRRTLTTSKKWRWFDNLSIFAINPVVLRLMFPVLAIGMAQIAQAKKPGTTGADYTDILH